MNTNHGQLLQNFSAAVSQLHKAYENAVNIDVEDMDNFLKWSLAYEVLKSDISYFVEEIDAIVSIASADFQEVGGQ